MSTFQDLPSVYCWSKMGYDARQSLDVTLRRKDHERLYGDGEVWWGVGELYLRKRIQTLVEHTSPNAPLVVLTPDRKAQAAKKRVQRFRRHGKNNEEVVVWRDYLVGTTQAKIPAHVLVLSAANTEGGAPKSEYSAIVCKPEEPLTHIPGGSIYANQYRNLVTQKDRFGQQVTIAIQRKNPVILPAGEPYRIFVRARFVRFVKLTNPRPYPLSDRERQLTDEAGVRQLSWGEWSEIVRLIRADE